VTAADLHAATGSDRAAWATGARRVVFSRLWAPILLALVLGALTFAMDSRGFLSTDTGGKVATLDLMVERGDWRSDVEYWAADLDPNGHLHPLYNTSPVGDQWVNATSLPMLLAARPLHALGGTQLALAVPIAGTVVAALAAWAIAERVRTGTGARAFWLVGLAGPLTIYAMDLWEHSLGVALIGWAFVLSMDALKRSPIVTGLAIGALAGLAGTMRTEALVYGAVVVCGAAITLLAARRSVVGPLLLGVSAIVTVAGVTVANSWIEESLMGGTYRSGRTSSAASSIGGDLALRLKEAIVTGVELFPGMEPEVLLLGIGLLGALVWLVARPTDDRTTLLVAAMVGSLYFLRIAHGLGFVPGLFAAAPIGVVALVRGGRHRSARLPLIMAVVAMPLVWLSQYLGGAMPQWGGRYLLPSMLVLCAIGAALLDEVGVIARRTVVALAVVVTAFGLVWTSQRTHDIAAHGGQVVAGADGAMISDSAFWLRELGAFYDPERPWLTAQGTADRTRAVKVLEEAGFDEFDILHVASSEAPTVPGYAIEGEQTVGGLSTVEFELTHYVQE
jgi:hypothetical protein